MQKHSAKLIVMLATYLMGSLSQAALIDRGDGFIYDDVLNITWTQNAAINGLAVSGLATWDNQVAWAAGYSQTHSVYGTFDDWRLASMDVNGDGTIVDCSSAGEVACRDNEYGYLFRQYGVSSSSPSLFMNVAGGDYWSGTELPNPSSSSISAWYLNFGTGAQGTLGKTRLGYGSWAVRDGDIAAIAVSEPSSLAALGVAAIIYHLRRRRAGFERERRQNFCTDV